MSVIRNPRLRNAPTAVKVEWEPSECDFAGYRTVAQQVEALMLAGAELSALRAGADPHADYDSDLYPDDVDPADMDVRGFSRMSEFAEVSEFVKAIERSNRRYEHAQQKAREEAQQRIEVMQQEYARLVGEKRASEAAGNKSGPVGAVSTGPATNAS